MTSTGRAKKQKPTPDVHTWQTIMRQLATATSYHLPQRRW